MGNEEKDTGYLKGVGDRKKEEWAKKGIKTLSDVSSKKPEELAKILEIDEGLAKRYVLEATRILDEDRIVIKSAKEILDEQEKFTQFISTGSKKIDSIIGGGIQTGASTLFAGKSGAGKTQIGEQACVNCVVDLKRKALLIITEPKTCKPKRMLQMAMLGKNKEISLDKDIFVIDYPNFDLPEERWSEIPQKLYRAYREAEKYLEKGEDIGLIVVDSFTALFRKAYLGRGTLAARNQEFAKHIGYLQRLAGRYNIAILLTGQIYGCPDDSYEEQRRFGIAEHIYGGEFFLHSMTYGVSLDFISGGKGKNEKDEEIWEAFLFKSPDERRAKADFKLCAEGVRDSE